MNFRTEKADGTRADSGIPRWLTLRRLVGFTICAIGCLVLLGSLVEQIMNANPKMHAALLGGGTAAAATALGTLPVLMAQNFSKRSYDCFLGFGAGVMLGATAFSLVIPALAPALAPWLANAAPPPSRRAVTCQTGSEASITASARRAPPRGRMAV